MEIPDRFRVPQFRFVLISPKEKKPIEDKWTTEANYPHYHPKIKYHTGNIGILTGIGNLVIFDCDCLQAENLARQFGTTLVIGTSTTPEGYRKKHFYFFSGLKDRQVLDDYDKHLGEIQAKGQQCLIPPSIHPSGAKYEVLEDNPIRTVKEEDLLRAISPFVDSKRGAISKRTDTLKEETDSICAEIKEKIKVSDLLKKYGFDMTKNPTKCLWHESQGGQCFSYEADLWHCFHCERAGNIFHLMMAHEGVSFVEAKRKLTKEANIDIEKKRKQKVKLKTAMENYANYISMANAFVEQQPLFYDKHKSWWMWDFEECKYELVDETDIMNAVDDSLESAAFTIRSKEKTEILESLKRVGRKNIPKEFPRTWVQFRNRIINLDTNEETEPTPEYFCTNPIPWDVGETDETPIMDRIFSEWAHSDYVPMLREIIAYCVLQDYPLHRIFCLTGGGSNGKSKYLGIIKKFVGEDNVVSTSLERLISGRFETACLHKKLVVQMGETNFHTLEKTDIIKRATGGDLIAGEYKGKPKFDFYNYGKFIIATNTLPVTMDKTSGFYRRWLIIDFPNKFSEKRDVLNDVPEHEYENLANRCVKILVQILKDRQFTNEGTEDDRMKRFEERSNPVLMFINNGFAQGANCKIPFSELAEEIETYLAENNLRKMSKLEIGKIIRNEGYEIKKTSAERGGETINGRWVLGIDLKGKANSEEEVPLVPHVTLLSFDSLPIENDLEVGHKSHKSHKPNSLVVKNKSNKSLIQQKFLDWRHSGVEKTEDEILQVFPLHFYNNLKEMGQIFETSPGRYKTI